MSPSVRYGLALVVGLVLGAAACRRETAEPRAGRLSVRVTGRDSTPAPRPRRDSTAAARGDTAARRRDTARAARRDTTPPRARRDTAALLAFSARAVAEWCDSLHMLQLRATTGDSGVAIAVYPGARLQPGEYPIRPPDHADTATPPAAAVAARWLSATSVQGFQAESGAVTLTRAADGTLGGRFHGTGHGVPISLRLSIGGSFDGVRAVPAPKSCAGTPHADTTRAAAGDEDDDSGDGVD